MIGFGNIENQSLKQGWSTLLSSFGPFVACLLQGDVVANETFIFVEQALEAL